MIGDSIEESVLGNLGASINVIPYKIFMTLVLGEPTPTKMAIQLTDRSIRHPKGVVKDMLVKVDKFIFLNDFVIHEVNEKVEVPLILDHPFLATSKALIDVNDGKMVLRVGEDKVIFKLH